MRPLPQVGANLFVCIPPDHQRDDLPSTVTVADSNCTPVYVGITDDMGNTVTLPCFDVQWYVDGKVVFMAHRTGRPVR